MGDDPLRDTDPPADVEAAVAPLPERGDGGGDGDGDGDERTGGSDGDASAVTPGVDGAGAGVGGDLDEDDDLDVVYEFADGPFAEETAAGLSLTTRLARSVAGAMMSGVGSTLQELYEGRPKQEDAIVAEAPDDEPLPDDPIWIDFDPLDPGATIIHVRDRAPG